MASVTHVVGTARAASADEGDGRILAIVGEASRELAAAQAEPALRRVMELVLRQGGVAAATVALVDRPGRDIRVESPRPVGSPGTLDTSAVAIPLALAGTTLGTVTADLPPHDEAHRLRVTRLLETLAPIIALAARAWIASERDEPLAAENARLRRELQDRHSFADIIGGSGPMREVCSQIAQVASTSMPVWLQGEPGSGKALIARTIHYNSPRAGQPFVTASCAALPEGALDAELFGRGANGGAVEAAKGRVERADRGTLYLDEAAALDPVAQMKLLRVVREQELERPGGAVRVDVRLIVASTRDVQREAADGGLHFHDRLSMFPIFVPPLRERRSDIPMLADFLVAKFARAHGKRVARVSARAVDMLVTYHWPGNVRELANALERAVVLCEDHVIHVHHLPATVQTKDVSEKETPISLGDALAAYEKDLLEDALESARGVRSKAARLLKTTDRIFNYKLRKHGIDFRRFKS